MEIACPACGLQADYVRQSIGGARLGTFHAASAKTRSLCQEPDQRDRYPGSCRWFQDQAHRLTGRPVSPPRSPKEQPTGEA
jgi:hypothetical protein